MKPTILFIAESGPFPPVDGKRQRTLAFLKALECGYKVDYLIIGHQGDFEKAIALNTNPDRSFHFLGNNSSFGNTWLKKIGFLFNYSSGLRKEVSAFCERKDYAFVFSRYLNPCSLIPSGPRLFADIDDNFNELYASRIKVATSFYMRLRLIQIQMLNQSTFRKLLRKLDLAIVVKDERLPVRQLIMENIPFQTLLNGIPDFQVSTLPNLLFVGKLTYEPNSAGLIWFLEQLYPVLLSKISGLSLQVVSSEVPQDEKLLSLLAGRGIQVNYRVESLSEFYSKSSLVIAPIFQGAGSNLKVAEAISYGRPVVCSNFATKGFEEQLHLGLIFEADTATEMSAQIMSLLKEPNELGKLQKRIFDWAETNYSLEKWSNKLLNAF